MFVSAVISVFLNYSVIEAASSESSVFSSTNLGFEENEAWAQDSIDALVAREAITGIGNGLFNTNGSVTRAELITMVMNAFELVILRR